MEPGDVLTCRGEIEELISLQAKEEEGLNCKLSDSACGSLFDSEESGSKCHENDSNGCDDDLDPVTDSLSCDPVDDSYVTEDEYTEGDTTFNANTPDDSEISELPNDYTHFPFSAELIEENVRDTKQNSLPTCTPRDDIRVNSNKNEDDVDNCKNNCLNSDTPKNISSNDCDTHLTDNISSEHQNIIQDDLDNELHSNDEKKLIPVLLELDSIIKERNGDYQENLSDASQKPKEEYGSLKSSSGKLEQKSNKLPKKSRNRFKKLKMKQKEEFIIEIFEPKRAVKTEVVLDNKLLNNADDKNLSSSLRNDDLEETESINKTDQPVKICEVLSCKAATGSEKAEPLPDGGVLPGESESERNPENSAKETSLDSKTGISATTVAKSIENLNSSEKPLISDRKSSEKTSLHCRLENENFRPEGIDFNAPVESEGDSVITPTREKQPNHLAFTVALDTPSIKPEKGQQVGLSKSIPNWAPKHRRNHSLSKVEENKKIEEKSVSDKPPVGRRKALLNSGGALSPKKGGAGSNSEGYFSSDQEDDSLKKSDQLASSGSSGRQPQNRDVSLRIRPPSPFSPASTYSEPLTETASILIDKMTAATPEIKRKQSTYTDKRQCCKEREVKSRSSNVLKKAPNLEKKMSCEEKKSSQKITPLDYQCLEDEKDDISETGTYTIDKDSSSHEEAQARNGIDEVFGVDHQREFESSISNPMNTSSCTLLEDDSHWTSTTEHPPNMSRSNPNWIHHWAAHVAEQTKPPIDTSRSHGQGFSEDDSRYRKKISSSPHLLKRQSSPRTNFQTSKYQGRTMLLKGKRTASFESHESGADLDSDFDTSLSCPLTEEERFCSSLSSRLRLGSEGDAISDRECRSFRNRFAASNIGNGSSCSKDRNSLYGSPRVLSMNGDLYENYETCEEERDPQSDSSSEAIDYKEASAVPENNPPLKFNRAFSLRRARLGLDNSGPPSQPIPPKKKLSRPFSANSPSNTRKVSSGSARSPQNNNASNFGQRKDKTNSKKHSARSGSSLSSKETDFQNWKRRKNYDPMKAAAEGKKKQIEKKLQHRESHCPSSPSSSIHRSASFHGTANGPNFTRWPLRGSGRGSYKRQDDDEDDEEMEPYSLEEDFRLHPSCRGGPLMRSPTSPRQPPQSPAHRPINVRGRRASFGRCDDSASSINRKQSIEDTGSVCEKISLTEARRMNSLPSSAPPSKPKAKMEALDNLVISTIHSLSVKVRSTSESLLQKLKSQYDEEGDRAALLDEVLSHLSESDHSLTHGQTRSTSRELAGILRNLKSIEHAMEVIDRVIVVGEDEELYCEDDTDYIPSDWLE